MVDYNRSAATSERLITKNGRMITFKKVSRTPEDADRPWRGPEVDADGGPEVEAELTLPAVFAPPNTVRQFGLTALGEGSQIEDLFSFVEKIAIVYPGENDLTQYSIVTDQGVDWNMVAYQLLQPANRKLVAYVGIRR